MGACLSAPRPAAADAPSSSSVSSARTFGVTPAKASAAADARVEPVRSDAPGRRLSRRPRAARGAARGRARARRRPRRLRLVPPAKVRDDPEPIARALAKEWDAPGAEVAPASDAGAGPADATDDRAPPAEEPVELERDVELELSASDASDDDAPAPGGDAPTTRRRAMTSASPERRGRRRRRGPAPREPSEEEANEEEDRDDDDDDDDAGSGPGSRGAASPPESKARSSNAADSDFEDDFEDTLSMIDMGPVSDSEEDSDYGSVADPAEAALAEEAIPEDARERGGARSEERTRPPSEEEAPEVEPPVDDAPPPGRGDEVASEGEVLGEEARGSADAAAAAEAAAAEEAAETTGASRDERPSDQPADDPASETLDERPSDQPADESASDASSGYESTVYSDEEADDFDAELGPTVLSTVEPREQTVDANLVEVLARSKHSPPPTARTRGFVGQVTPRDGSHPSSRGATPLGSARSGGSHASDQAKADSDSSRGPFGWLPFGGGGGGARSARSAGRGGGVHGSLGRLERRLDDGRRVVRHEFEHGAEDGGAVPEGEADAREPRGGFPRARRVDGDGV